MKTWWSGIKPKWSRIEFSDTKRYFWSMNCHFLTIYVEPAKGESDQDWHLFVCSDVNEKEYKQPFRGSEAEAKLRARALAVGVFDDMVKKLMTRVQ